MRIRPEEERRFCEGKEEAELSCALSSLAVGESAKIAALGMWGQEIQQWSGGIVFGFFHATSLSLSSFL